MLAQRYENERKTTAKSYQQGVEKKSSYYKVYECRVFCNFERKMTFIDERG